MKVKCINPYFQLEKNKIYEVVDENKEFYYVSDELGYIGGFFKERFEIVKNDDFAWWYGKITKVLDNVTKILYDKGIKYIEKKYGCEKEE